MFLRGLRHLLSFLLVVSLFSHLAFGQTTRIDNRYIQPAQQTQNLGLITPQAPTGGRTIKFVNSCPFAVWLGAVGGAASKPCSTDSQCGTGNVCGKDNHCSCSKDADCGVSRGCAANPKAADRRCFWVMPQPKSGWWVLLPRGQSFLGFGSTTVFEFPDTGVTQRWNGKFYPRTRCTTDANDNLVCATGSCNKMICNDPGVGPVGAGPYTLIEFDLENSSGDAVNYDTYDVGLIHGMNVPADIKPDPAGTYPAGTGENYMYWCGAAAGNPASSDQLTACTYKFTPGAMNYLEVTGGGKLCATDKDCALPTQKCGLAWQSVNPPTTTTNWGKLTCGTPLAWWSPTAICGNNANFGPANTSLFNCAQTLNEAYPTLSDLYQCNGADTCYKDSPDARCCGCKDWGYPAFPNCKLPYDKWVSDVLPKIQFIKDACPTAYSYQYDDKTTTFTCSTTAKPNTANYIVTLCPGGNTGLPSTTTPTN